MMSKTNSKNTVTAKHHETLTSNAQVKSTREKRAHSPKSPSPSQPILFDQVHLSPQELWLNNFTESLSRTQIQLKSKHAISHEIAAENFKNFLDNTRKEKGTVWILGNGGSAATANHMAQDILNRLKVRTETLSSGTLLTCMSNDFSYEESFLRPFKQYAEKTDLLILLSCSGESPNLVNTAKYALQQGIRLVTLTAMKPRNTLDSLASDLSFWVPTESYGVGEVAHHAILHSHIETLAETEKYYAIGNQIDEVKKVTESLYSLV